MQTSTSVLVCLLLFVTRSISGHVVDEHRAEVYGDDGADQKEGKLRDIKPESVLMGLAKTLIGGKTGAASGQSLSLNMSNLVLMLVLRGLIWGVSYMQNGGGVKEARNEDSTTVGGLFQDMVTETDVMLFLGYLVADESGRYECLNRVACEQPERAESYFKTAEMVWKTAKMFDDVIPLDSKYEKTLTRLQEAIENGMADGDCESKYKCFGPTNSDTFKF
ncbi:uncharacterized protein LOC113554386 [Rhopalosiphum maidis]|uniref:uncharacterized protein LOC113554386 n=1 Tax=Rhopalosiphum maidis TaxID=43146 RepID=UPI000EFE5E75|nr:uncharacterized protein LOC113554386 [Rhopalosiphum maidis]